MTYRQILFSFQGRSRRLHYWMLILLPVLFSMALGMIMGGLTVAESMIATAKAKKAGMTSVSTLNSSNPLEFCQQATAANKYSGDCHELAMLSADYSEQRKVNTTESDVDLAAQVCMLAQEQGRYMGDCVEAMPLIRKMNANSSGTGQELSQELGGATNMLKAKLAGFGIALFGMIIVYVLYIWISLAIITKRLHDRNMSGWWQLAPLGFGILTIIPVIGLLFGLASIICGIWLFVVCGFLPGTPGSNNFGADPFEKPLPPRKPTIKNPPPNIQ